MMNNILHFESVIGNTNDQAEDDSLTYTTTNDGRVTIYAMKDCMVEVETKRLHTNKEERK